MIRDGWCRGQAGRLDANELDGLWHVRVARYDKINDAFVAWGSELRAKPSVAELQVALFDFRQPILLVVIFSFHIGCRRAQEKRSPQSLGEMHAEAQAVAMW